MIINTDNINSEIINLIINNSITSLADSVLNGSTSQAGTTTDETIGFSVPLVSEAIC